MLRTLSASRGAILRVLLLVTFALLAQVGRVSAETQHPTVAAATRHLTQAKPSALARQAFHERMLAIKRPHAGCFVARYGKPTWTEIPCGAPPKYPNPIPRGPKPNNVGAGTDYFTSVSGLTSATGSFDSVTGVTNEYGSKGNDLTTVYPNVYALQLNSNIFAAPPACSGSSNCSGWEQFIYSQSQCGTQACIFIEYWLLNHTSPCPATGGWNFYAGTPTTTPGCYLNTAFAYFPVQTLSAMSGLRLTGEVSGGTDTVTVSVANGDVYTNTNPSIADLGTGWSGAEFNLVGDCCASEAYFTGRAGDARRQAEHPERLDHRADLHHLVHGNDRRAEQPQSGGSVHGVLRGLAGDRVVGERDLK